MPATPVTEPRDRWSAQRTLLRPQARGTLRLAGPCRSAWSRLASSRSTRPLSPTRPDQTMSSLSDLYKSDFHAWTRQAAALVREHKLDELNLDDLAEELARRLY